MNLMFTFSLTKMALHKKKREINMKNNREDYYFFVYLRVSLSKAVAFNSE
jgi:hypothetical protein